MTNKTADMFGSLIPISERIKAEIERRIEAHIASEVERALSGILPGLTAVVAEPSQPEKVAAPTSTQKRTRNPSSQFCPKGSWISLSHNRATARITGRYTLRVADACKIFLSDGPVPRFKLASQVAEHMKVERNTLSSAISKLIQAGLLVVADAPGNAMVGSHQIISRPASSAHN